MNQQILNVDYNEFAIEQMPPDRRTPKMTNLVQALFAPLQWLSNLWMGSYINGSSANTYVPGNVYGLYDEVKYNGSVYSSTIDNNTDNPSVAESWELIQDTFLGVNQRLQFTGQKISLEYALNLMYGTTFRQPPNQSDIYIENQPMVIVGFRVASSSGSTIGATKSSDDIGSISLYSQPVNFNVYVPSSVFNNYTEQEIRNFISSIIPQSINFQIIKI